MSERRYTLAEIDGMREALRARHGHYEHSGCEPASDSIDWHEDVRRSVEDELRTAMIGGVDPAEMIAADAAKEE